jgi:cytochrome P450
MGGRTRARPGDRMDGVTGLARPLVSDFLGRYFGVFGPESEILLRWARALTRAIFCNDSNDPAILDAAREAKAELGGYLDVMLASRRTLLAVGKSAGPDAVGRLLALQHAETGRPDDRRLRDILIGVVVVSSEPMIAAIAHAVQEILSRPEIQTQALESLAADQTPVLAAIVDEALRFSPPLWTPMRLCTRAFTLARGTANETILRPGTRVLASVFSADFDPAEVEAPEEFRPGRRSHQSLGFGIGLHACLGRHVAPVLVRAAVAALLRNGRVQTLADRVGFEGPFPASLPLEFLG